MYNGNELQSDFGLNTYDFNYRMYDPAIGRFWQIDPLADQINQIDKSPFAFAWNNPITLSDPSGLAPENIGVDKDGNVIFDDGKEDGNLFLVNEGVEKISSLEDLQANSAQLSKDHVWTGSDEQLLDYVKNQWEQSGNDLGFLIHEMDIEINSRGFGFSAKSILAKADEDGNTLMNSRPLKDYKFVIRYQKEDENHHLSNPYNTRNAIEHEKQHFKQSIRHSHQEKGWIPYNKAQRELEAIRIQRTLPSWAKTTKVFKEISKNYENKF